MTSITLETPQAQVSGSNLVVTVVWPEDENEPEVTAISDARGNTYTKGEIVPVLNHCLGREYYSECIIGGVNPVTVTFTQSSVYDVEVKELWVRRSGLLATIISGIRKLLNIVTDSLLVSMKWMRR